jgi:hypothetical protein
MLLGVFSTLLAYGKMIVWQKSAWPALHEWNFRVVLYE